MSLARAIGLLALGLAACQPNVATPDAAPVAASLDVEVAAAALPAPAEPPAPPQPAPYKPTTVSLRVKRSIMVRAEPREDAKSLGTIAQDTRVGWNQLFTGSGCPRWVGIEPYGYVCDRYLEPTRKTPIGVELPKLAPDELVPGVYGKVTGQGAKTYLTLNDALEDNEARTLAGSVTVRMKREVPAEVGGKNVTFWETTAGELIDSARLSLHKPSQFAGVSLAGTAAAQQLKLPIAWVQSRQDLRESVAVRRAPGSSADARRKLAPRTVVAVLDSSPDGRFMRIESNPTSELPGVLRAPEGAPVKEEWVSAADLHVARLVPPPPTTADDERWFDVDLDEQVLVAYEGSRPAYATLVSTGNRKWPTPAGIYRVWIKFAETDMNGQMGDEQAYSVATVPWTMFYAKDLALHTSYWHDRFGEPRSHGCVNLSPVDARTLYFWSAPEVPLGWSMANGIAERPGSIVRIHSKEFPEPEFQGYAKRVYEDRVAQRAQDAGAVD